MKGILRWIFVAILIAIIVLLFINLGKSGKNKNQPIKEPIVYEKSEIPNDSIDDTSLVPINEVEESIEVGDTASFSTISIFIGVFITAIGLFYIHRVSTN